MVKEAIELIWKAFDKEKASKGYRLLRQAAEGGDADAYCFLGRCHLGEEFVWDGAGFHVDEALASVYLKESVRRGSSHGVLCALRTQDLTPSVAREMPFASTKEAFLNVVRQADSGDAFSQYVVGNVMFWGDFLTIEGEKETDKYETEEDYDSYAYPIAAKYYEMSFDGGLGAAFGNYRTIYESGLADISDDTYESYLKALSDIGNPLACSDYGKLLEDVYDDAEGAFRHYLMAFERGDLQSAYNVGVCYGRGYGVDADPDEAFRYYMVAAEAGNANAQFQVGNFYFMGRGNIGCDYAKAVRWLTKAYENSDDGWEAAAELAICYQDGRGVMQDDSTAFGYLSEIEDRVDEVWEPLDAMVLNALGVAYAFGRGVDEDIETGMAYFDRAIEYGSEAAVRNKAMFRRSVFGLGGWKKR